MLKSSKFADISVFRSISLFNILITRPNGHPADIGQSDSSTITEDLFFCSFNSFSGIKKSEPSLLL